MRVNRFRLLTNERVRSYKTQEARDSNAQRVADETGRWVGLEVWDNGDWWLERVVQPSSSS